MLKAGQANRKGPRQPQHEWIGSPFDRFETCEKCSVSPLRFPHEEDRMREQRQDKRNGELQAPLSLVRESGDR
jgi:hypothetical protein